MFTTSIKNSDATLKPIFEEAKDMMTLRGTILILHQNIMITI